MTTHYDGCIEASLTHVAESEGLSIERDTNNQLAGVGTFTNPVIEGVVYILAGIPEVWERNVWLNINLSVVWRQNSNTAVVVYVCVMRNV